MFVSDDFYCSHVIVAISLDLSMIRTLKRCKAWCLDLQPLDALQALDVSNRKPCREYNPSIQTWKGAVRRFKPVLAGLCDANVSQA